MGYLACPSYLASIFPSQNVVEALAEELIHIVRKFLGQNPMIIEVLVALMAVTRTMSFWF